MQLSEVTQLASGALAIAFIGLLEALSTAKVIAYQSGQKIDYRQIIAEGLANLTGGFFQAVPGLRFGDALADQLPGRRGDPVLGRGRFRRRRDHRAVVRAATALHARAALAGLLLITAARLIDIKRLSYAIKASRYDTGLVILTALVGVLVDLDGAARCCVVDPAGRAAGGQAQG